MPFAHTTHVQTSAKNFKTKCRVPSVWSVPFTGSVVSNDSAHNPETCCCGQGAHRLVPTQEMLRATAKKLRMTPSRLEALQLVADGHKHKVAAGMLGIRVRTH